MGVVHVQVRGYKAWLRRSGVPGTLVFLCYCGRARELQWYLRGFYARRIGGWRACWEYALSVLLNGLNGHLNGLENGNGTVQCGLGPIWCIKQRTHLHGLKR